MAKADCMYIADVFRESGRYDLMGEFIETLVNDTEVPTLTSRRIWTLASTSYEQQTEACAAIVASFQDSEGSEDLTTRWNEVVRDYWSYLSECPLKEELS